MPPKPMSVFFKSNVPTFLFGSLKLASLDVVLTFLLLIGFASPTTVATTSYPLSEIAGTLV